MSTTRWATFDCFGTLVDWRHGIRTSAELLFPGRGAEVLDRYNAHEPDRRARAADGPLPRRARRDPAPGVRRPRPRARRRRRRRSSAPPSSTGRCSRTSPPSSARCAPAGWRLALLTNCDRDIIGATQRRLGVIIDAVVTAEAVGSYKPALGHFTRFAESFAPAPGRVGPRGRGLHVRHAAGTRAGHPDGCGSTARASSATNRSSTPCSATWAASAAAVERVAAG